jgi:serine/threonine protein kinase
MDNLITALRLSKTLSRLRLHMLKLQIGRAIAAASGDYYRLVQPIGEGKNAHAFLAFKTSNTDAGSFCALKFIKNADDPNKLSSFRSEIAALTELDHPSILPILDTGEYSFGGPTYPFYVCKYYPETLTTAFQRGLQLTRRLAIACQLTSGLAYLESKQVVHCDVKPDNIFLGGFDCVLADFGLSKLPQADGDNWLGPSLHRYRSPDLAAYLNGGPSPSFKSDVFQLGLVLTELFTGENVCRESSDGSDPVELNTIPEIHGSQSRLITKILQEMLEPDGHQRPPASKMVDRWQQVLFNAIEKRWELEDRIF